MMMFFLEKNMKKWKIGISVMLVLCIFMLTACGSKKVLIINRHRMRAIVLQFLFRNHSKVCLV